MRLFLESEFRRYHLLKKDNYKEKQAREDNIYINKFVNCCSCSIKPRLVCASGASNFATSAFLQLLADWTFLRNWKILRNLMARNQPFFIISYPGPKDFQSVVIEMTVLHNESLENIFGGLGWRICGFAETTFSLYGVKSAGESLTKLLMELSSPQG